MAQSYTTLKTEQPHTNTRITHHYSYWILPIGEHSFDHSPSFQGPSVIPDDQRGVHEVSHVHGHNMYAVIRGTLIGRGGQDTAMIVLPKTVQGGENSGGTIIGATSIWSTKHYCHCCLYLTLILATNCPLPPTGVHGGTIAMSSWWQ